MGIEGLVPIILVVGVGLFLFLIARSFDRAARPYALPTLLAAIGFAAFLSSRDGHDRSHLWSSFIAWFGLGAIVFGVHAHLIRWLSNRRGSGGPAS